MENLNEKNNFLDLTNSDLETINGGGWGKVLIKIIEGAGVVDAIHDAYTGFVDGWKTGSPK